jgi:hypothetical protein
MGLSVNDVTFHNSHKTYPNGTYKYIDYLVTLLDGRVIPPQPPKVKFPLKEKIRKILICCKDIEFRFIIEYNSLRDFGLEVLALFLYEEF